jgi:hypothetical protein
MSGKGELVKYTRLFKRGPLSGRDKRELKAKINAIIDEASQTITVMAVVEASREDLIKGLKRKGLKKR